MLSIDIPGLGIYNVEYLVLDVNGTVAHDGRIIDGVAAALDQLKPVLRVSAITADTHGTCSLLREQLGIDVHVIGAGGEAEAKLDYVEELGADAVVAMGNGANDGLMLRAAAIGIAVVGDEGCSAMAIRDADIVSNGIISAMGLLLEPKRLIATLRR
jgi:soluble P-type ATPase